MKQESINLLQTILLILDKVPESDLLLKYKLGNYIKKAKEIIKQNDL
jgi:hypothetical protein